MQYIATIDQNRIIHNFELLADDYKPSYEELIVSRRALIPLADAITNQEGNVIKVKSNVSKIESLDDILYLDNKGNQTTFDVHICGYQDANSMIRLTELKTIKSNETYQTNIFIPVSKVVFDALSNYRDVLRLGTIYSLKTDGVISVDDLKIVNSNSSNPENLTQSDIPLESYKSLISLKAQDLLISRVNIKIILDMYNFILLNNELSINGYAVTSTNIKDVSDRISKSGNTTLANDFQSCIKVMDSLNSYNSLYQSYMSLTDSLNECKTTQEMDNKFDAYKNLFQ